MSTFISVRPMSPEAMARTISAGSSVVDLQHPTPDLKALHGAHIGNIEKLEQTAERISMDGCDIGEEIRKMRQEQRRTESRRSSFARPHTAEDPKYKPGSARSRNASTSSYANSVVDINSAARMGGYSPNAYFTSPLGSIRSGSWSHSSMRRVSASSKSRFVQFPQSEIEGPHLDLPIGSPFPEVPPAAGSVDSAKRYQYHQVAAELKDNLSVVAAAPDNVDRTQTLSNHMFEDRSRMEAPDRPPSAASNYTYRQANTLFQDFDGVHYAPSIRESIADVDRRTRDMHRASKAQLEAGSHSNAEPLPSDDLVYYPAPVPVMLNLPKRLSQMPLGALADKRRSQFHSSLSEDAARSRSGLPQGESESTEELPSSGHPDNARTTVLEARRRRYNLATLPPQLRASMFFDQQHSVPHKVDIVDHSAVATLEDILDASTDAPVSGFTEQPTPGRPTHAVYGNTTEARSNSSLYLNDIDDPARKSRSSVNLVNELSKVQPRSSSDVLGDEQKEPKKSRSSLLLNFAKRFSTGHAKKAQKSDTTGTSSKINHGSKLSTGDISEAGPLDQEQSIPPVTPSHDLDETRDLEAEDAVEDPQEDSRLVDEAQELPDEGRPLYAKPQTLMAEIDIRKDHQKKRNLAAANAFPAGMHSTLLEQDAVRQIQKQARQKHRVQLAWDNEDTGADDDDVPLGQLFPQMNRNGLVNGGINASGPRGLMEQRQLEDHEPLSRRRNRLIGNDRSNPLLPVGPDPSNSNLRPPHQNEAGKNSDEEVEETMAQRKQRLQKLAALSTQLGGVGLPNSEAFTDELISHFDGLDVKSTEQGNAQDVVQVTLNAREEDIENETLAQRRKRLQALAQLAGDMPLQSREVSNGTVASNPQPPTQPSSRPPPRTSHSIPNILSAHPNTSNAARDLPNEVGVNQGVLLHLHEQTKEKHQQAIMANHTKNGSLGAVPIVDPNPDWRHTQMGSQLNYKAIGGVAAGSAAYAGVTNGYHYGDHFGGTGFIQPPMQLPMAMPMQMPMHTPISLPGTTYHAASTSFGSSGLTGWGIPGFNISPMTGYSVPMLGSGYGVSNPYKTVNGNPYGTAGMMTFGQGMTPMIDPATESKQRDMVDRWRQSIM